MKIEIERILETMIDGHVLVDIEGRIISANSSYCKMSGYSKEELLELALHDIQSIYDNKKVKERIEKVIKQGFDKFESIHKRKDGSKYPVEVSISTIFENNNDYFLGTFRDITEKKQLNEKLETSEKIFNHSLDMLCIAGFDGYFKVLNPAWEKTLGWSNEEMLEKPWIEFVYPDDIDTTNNVKSVIVDGKEIYQFENRYICKNGDVKWLSWNSFPYPDENIMFGVARDITEQKLAEINLMKSKRLLSQAEEIADMGSWEWDSENDIAYWSDGLFRIFMRSPKEGAPKFAQQSELYETESYENLKRSVNECLKNGKPYELEMQIIRSDGEIRTCISRGRAEKNQEGKINRLWGSFNDITERKKTEEQLLVSKKTAEKANRAKSEFLSNMSHEIRTPMNGIFGFIDILYIMENDEEKREYLDAVKQCSGQLLGIVNDILSLSKIEAGKYALAENTVDLFWVIDKIANIYKRQAKAKGLDFMIDIDKKLKKKVIIDEKSLVQILNNLLSNAIKFTQNGFVLLIVTEICENKIEIRVKDTGIGIDKEKQKRLFDQFDQGEHYLTKNYGGTGLGLSIVKKLVDILEGKIEVETEEGKGTQFGVTIPFKVSDKNIEEKEINKFENPKNDRKIRIISAEDVEINQKLLEKMFKDKGWEMTKTYNGKELIEKLEKENYDIILMDIQMPIMNGFEATKSIRNDKRYDGIPIIGVSAYALEEDIKKALTIGMNDYISKPLKKDELIEMIDKWVKNNTSDNNVYTI